MTKTQTPEVDTKKKVKELSVKILGNFVQSYLISYFKDLDKKLKKAELSYTPLEYVSTTLVTVLAVFFAQTILFTLIFTLLTGKLLTGVIVGFSGGLISSIAIFMFSYMYPIFHIGDVKKNIDGMLPFSTLYLTTMAGSGTPPITMFRTLARFGDYGEVAKESQRITQETDILGLNVLDAIKNAAERTPSEQFSDLLWGIRTVIMSGGDLKTYLREKSALSMNEYRRHLKEYADQLSMLVEIYITIIMIGVVFFLILSTIMGAMSGGGLQNIIVGVQLILVFILIPVASLGLLVLLKGISPKAGY